MQRGGGGERLSLLSVSPFASGSPVIESFRDVVRYRNLLRDLIARDLKVRYKRSALGVLWTMLNPLLLMTILAFVFAHILRVTVPRFPVYILAALGCGTSSPRPRRGPRAAC